MSCFLFLVDAAVAVCVKEKRDFFWRHRLGGKLGRGNFGQVRRLTDLRIDDQAEDSSGLAVKIVDLRIDGLTVESPKRRGSAASERDVWRAVGHHRNVVALHETYMERSMCFFVMERCDQTLLKHLSSGAGDACLTERSLARTFAEILEALAHVHRHRFVHRDVKPDNVMVSGGVCKLVDFGLAAELPPRRQGLVGTYGSPSFMCPEMLQQKSYKTEADVWSMGVLAYLLCYGAFPYRPEKPYELESQGVLEMKRCISEGKVLPRFSPPSQREPTVSEEARAFVQELLNRDQSTRISAAAALELAFIRDTGTASAGLPSLEPLLARAEACGGFEERLPNSPERLDPVLQQLHARYTGVPLLEADTKASLARESTASSDVSFGEMQMERQESTGGMPMQMQTNARSAIPSGRKSQRAKVATGRSHASTGLSSATSAPSATATPSATLGSPSCSESASSR